MLHTEPVMGKTSVPLAKALLKSIKDFFVVFESEAVPHGVVCEYIFFGLLQHAGLEMRAIFFGTASGLLV